MKKAALLILLVALPAFGETFHLTSIQDHIRDKTEQSFSTPLHTRIYTGTIDGETVTAEEAVSVFSPASHFTVGHDYAVTKFKPEPGGALHVRQDPNKHGKSYDAWLTVVSVSEGK